VGLGFHLNATTLCLLFVLGTGPTAVAYTLYFRGLRSIGASTAAVMALLEPLTGALLAALVLRDRLGGPGIAGALLLAAAVILAAKAPNPANTPGGEASALDERRVSRDDTVR
jgi:DME family drug/metabolite transporter